MNVKKHIPIVGLFFLACLSNTLLVQGQKSTQTDTTRLDIKQAEKMLIDSNLLLLAEHYNVNAQQALIEQTKLWQNPTLNSDFMVAANGKVLSYGKNPDGSFQGQYYVQLQQLLLTAGKRSKLINIATTNKTLAELQLKDVLRNLRFQLHQDYYNIQLQLSTIQLYQQQLQQITALSKAMEAQFNAGNIALKERLRIQALEIALEQNLVTVKQSLYDLQSDIKTLLGIKNTETFVFPIDTQVSQAALNKSNLDDLIAEGMQNNPNYLLQQTSITYQQQNLSYQKALKTPDLTLGPNFDKNSNFAPNYVGLGISLPIPIFNKNQGNIKAAAANVQQQKAITQNTATDLINNITAAYRKTLLFEQLNNTTNNTFYEKYATVYQNMLNSYQQKQINLLEFIDFFNDYANTSLQLMQQKTNHQLSIAELNYYTGK